MPNFNEVTLRFDGSCKPNPGVGGSGYVIFNTKTEKTIIEGHYYVGEKCTKNVAEYFGLIAGLKHFKKCPYTAGHLNIEGDSELMIPPSKWTINDQVKYRTNVHRLKPLLERVINLLKDCHGGQKSASFSFARIDRRFNVRADALANDARYEENHGSQDLYDEGDGDDEY
ncbi:ribonuclease H-like protein [Fragilariopsis cylindrus CCMP1102]|uniref:Ribonuclease H-like protein n=1 Tax=Fragilariopsis cylindrus CCMP1102 TaxID=635003 RepID=A0A1E7F7K9_9STRA|nr:ribonuclease H-like protein [Fragilariopsis cylindrus CCMP1102]|eukprot:OEU13995.1 ribonuclease H-like protein [Fragilariopsis cylindrus CCMP1102]